MTFTSVAMVPPGLAVGSLGDHLCRISCEDQVRERSGPAKKAEV